MAFSIPESVFPISNLMKSRVANSLTSTYRLLLNAYPPAYRLQFGDEMYDTFFEGVVEAESLGILVTFLLREFRDIPVTLIKAHWEGWVAKLEAGIKVLQNITSTSGLPPAPPDGRTSGWHFFLEIMMFLVAGLFLLLATYIPIGGLRLGWQRDVQFLGSIVLPITIPLLLFGLMHGLPRWVYPLGGLMLTYSGVMVGQTGLWLFLTIMLFASFVLFLAAILTDPRPSPLPIPIRRIRQSISVDWTRLSFGIYGAMPLIILTAFDDAHANGHTPYFAFSILVMIVGALLYCRSRNATIQLTALLAGLTFSIWGAWLDQVSFADGLMNWITVTSSGLECILWMGVLWFHWTIFILLPVFFILFNKVIHLKRAI